MSTGEFNSKDDYSGLFRDCAQALARTHCHKKGNAKMLKSWSNQNRKDSIKRLEDFSMEYAEQTRAVQQVLINISTNKQNQKDSESDFRN